VTFEPKVTFLNSKVTFAFGTECYTADGDLLERSGPVPVLQVPRASGGLRHGRMRGMLYQRGVLTGNCGGRPEAVSTPRCAPAEINVDVSKHIVPGWIAEPSGEVDGSTSYV